MPQIAPVPIFSERCARVHLGQGRRRQSRHGRTSPNRRTADGFVSNRRSGKLTGVVIWGRGLQVPLNGLSGEELSPGSRADDTASPSVATLAYTVISVPP
jgi:hypothetical protein